MNVESFRESLQSSEAPAGIDVYLESLWYDARGNWEKSHQLIQDLPGVIAPWIHAYLHRKEGDIWNADYWYNRAGKKRPDKSLEEEWSDLVDYCIKKRAR
jgi:hypothetical protein